MTQEPKPNNVPPKEVVIKTLSKDSNAYSLSFLKEVGITPADLCGIIHDKKGNVRNDIFDCWNDICSSPIDYSAPNEIPYGTIEVYVWGMSGSGKTSILAALSNLARLNGISIHGCQLSLDKKQRNHWDYANYLNGFVAPKRYDNRVALFPPPTMDGAIGYIPLRVHSDAKKDKVDVGVSIIEVPKEIFKYCSNMKDYEGCSERSHSMYKRLQHYLHDSMNPKYHFFVIDGDMIADNSSEYDSSLENIAFLFNDGILLNKNNCKDIAIIVSKSDLWFPEDELLSRTLLPLPVERKSEITKRIVIDKYDFFIQRIDDFRENVLGIKKDPITIIPSSVGESFLKEICAVNLETIGIIVELLIQYASRLKRVNIIQRLLLLLWR